MVICNFSPSQIRTDSSLALNRSLPEVHAKSKELESVFQKVDDLEVSSTDTTRSSNSVVTLLLSTNHTVNVLVCVKVYA